jgi:class 3 adenylate cyclase
LQLPLVLRAWIHRPAPAERRIVTVLFCDLVGFTSLSEDLDPEDVATIQDAYFAMVRETVGRYGGRLEKFIGDAANGRLRHPAGA